MKIRSIITITAIGGLLFLTGVALAGPAPGLEIARHVIGAGGARAEAGMYGVDSTLGQPLVGVHRSGDTAVSTGFWATAGVEGGAGWEIYLPLLVRQG